MDNQLAKHHDIDFHYNLLARGQLCRLLSHTLHLADPEGEVLLVNTAWSPNSLQYY
jgi:hypothetical protein